MREPLVLVSPSLLVFMDLSPHLISVEKFPAFGGSVALIDLGGDIRTVVRKPLLLLVQHLNSLLDVFIG